MTVHRRRLDEDSAYVAARARIENFTFERARLRRVPRRANVVRIPVVVHVVYNTEEQNISEEQVRSQVAALNRDYRAANEDVVSVPQVWRTRVADTLIEF